jgi:hypothetical protein
MWFTGCLDSGITGGLRGDLRRFTKSLFNRLRRGNAGGAAELGAKLEGPPRHDPFPYGETANAPNGSIAALRRALPPDAM